MRSSSLRQNRHEVFSTILLALSVLAPVSVLADTITLSCRVDDGPGYQTLRVDFDKALIEEIGSDGNPVIAASAQISAVVIKWSIDKPETYRTFDNVQHSGTVHWAGEVNRLSGTGYMVQNLLGIVAATQQTLTCKAATQKF